jgi:hypothetical protein
LIKSITVNVTTTITTSATTSVTTTVTILDHHLVPQSFFQKVIINAILLFTINELEIAFG